MKTENKTDKVKKITDIEINLKNPDINLQKKEETEKEAPQVLNLYANLKGKENVQTRAQFIETGEKAAQFVREEKLQAVAEATKGVEIKGATEVEALS